MHLKLRTSWVALALVLSVGIARAQEAVPPATAAPPPPPTYAPPPPPQAPVYYAPPPAYWPQSPTLTPPVYHEELRRRWGLFSAGLGLFGAVWMTNAITAYMADTGYLAIPVAGPIVVAKQYSDDHTVCNVPLGAASVGVTSVSCSPSTDTRMVVGLLVFDALIQGGGLAMMLVGALTKARVRVPGHRVAILPATLPAGAGLAAIGHF
jgi:hypothetical protein